jgi:Dolichyl-phosphate-mannose-protein mannosyltransferase
VLNLAGRLAPWLLIALAFATRAYRLADYTVFQGDQGIDALAARRLIVEHALPFEGPATSAGGIHLGPLYYYLLALPMLVGGFDPLLEAVLMVVLGALAVGLLFWLVRVWFGFVPALAAATLYALSPAAIVAARSAWNPAPAPFFLLLALLGLAQCHRRRNGGWLLLTAFGLGSLIQFHYFTLGVVLVGLVFGLVEIVRSRLVGWGVLAAGVFLALLAPFVIHEMQTGLPNLQAAGRLASGPSPASDSVPRRVYAVLALGLVGGFLSAGVEPLAALIVLCVLVALVIGVVRRRTYSYVVVSALLGATLLQVVGYRGPIFEHYFVPLAPLLYLGLGGALALVSAPVCAIVATALVGLNVAYSPLRGEPIFHLARTEAVAAAVAARSDSERFGLWLMAPDDSDAAYRYQLKRLNQSPALPSEPLPGRVFILCQKPPCSAAELQSAAGPDWASAHLTWQTTLHGVTVVELQRSADP